MSTSQAIAETQGRLAELRNRERAERMDQLKIQLADAKATVRSAGTQYDKLHAEVLKLDAVYNGYEDRFQKLLGDAQNISRQVRYLTDEEAALLTEESEQRLAKVREQRTKAKTTLEQKRDAALQVQRTLVLAQRSVANLKDAIDGLLKKDATPLRGQFPAVFQG